MVFNMLIVPGLAIPTGGSIYKFFMNQVTKDYLITQNFYLVQSGNFFITLLIQQITFGFLANILQFGQLYNWFFSPCLFLASRRTSNSELVFLKREDENFEYGYSLAQIMTIFCIGLIYSWAHKISHSLYHDLIDHIFVF